MLKPLHQLLTLISIVLFFAPTVSFAETSAFVDGETDERVYIVVELDDVSDISTQNSSSFCESPVACPRWTALLWDGTNRDTIVYAGALYNISDGLIQSMTFNTVPGVVYDTLEVVGINKDGEEVAHGAPRFITLTHEILVSEESASISEATITEPSIESPDASEVGTEPTFVTGDTNTDATIITTF